MGGVEVSGREVCWQVANHVSLGQDAACQVHSLSDWLVGPFAFGDRRVTLVMLLVWHVQYGAPFVK